MLDVVYPLLATRDDCQELRYSLRSLEANVPHGRVIVVQDRARWLTNAEHIPVEHQSGDRFARVKRNLEALAYHLTCPERFAFWNDDFYRMTPLEQYETLHRPNDDLQPPRSNYFIQLRNTLDMLRRHGYREPRLFNVHAPMVIERNTLRCVLDMFANETDPWLWRTAYGNVAGLDSRQATDPKVHGKHDPLPGGDWVSTSPLSWRGGAGRLIRQTFQQPSRYEAG